MHLHVPVLVFQLIMTTDHPSHRNKAVIVGGTGILLGIQFLSLLLPLVEHILFS